MQHDLEQTIAVLSRTPAALEGLLHDLPEEWSQSNEGRDSWSAFDAVGHLIHADRTDWLPRTKWILEFGETRPFEPFDRLGQVRASMGKPLNQLLEEFSWVRGECVAELRGLRLEAADFERRGQHPTLGGVTLSQLLATWAVHDLTHVHQISRILAHQYREAVGPWSAYLGVLQCNGHSTP